MALATPAIPVRRPTGWPAKGFMLLLLGIPVFVWMKWRERKEQAPEAWSDPDWAFFNRAELPERKPPELRERTPAGID